MRFQAWWGRGCTEVKGPGSGACGLPQGVAPVSQWTLSHRAAQACALKQPLRKRATWPWAGMTTSWPLKGTEHTSQTSRVPELEIW